MSQLLIVSPGLGFRTYKKFIFSDYSVQELGETLNIKAEEKGFTIDDADLSDILFAHTSPIQGKYMNTCLVRTLLQKSLKVTQNLLPLSSNNTTLTSVVYRKVRYLHNV